MAATETSKFRNVWQDSNHSGWEMCAPPLSSCPHSVNFWEGPWKLKRVPSYIVIVDRYSFVIPGKARGVSTSAESRSLNNYQA